jgi:hypothetical protein
MCRLSAAILTGSITLVSVHVSAAVLAMNMYAGVYMDKVLLEKELPIKMVAYGRCFRTEAGAAGAAGKGLYRVHQFTKVG